MARCQHQTQHDALRVWRWQKPETEQSTKYNTITHTRPDAMQLLRDDMIPFYHDWLTFFLFIILDCFPFQPAFGPVIDLRVTIWSYMIWRSRFYFSYSPVMFLLLCFAGFLISLFLSWRCFLSTGACHISLPPTFDHARFDQWQDQTRLSHLRQTERMSWRTDTKPIAPASAPPLPAFTPTPFLFLPFSPPFLFSSFSSPFSFSFSFCRWSLSVLTVHFSVLH